MEEVLDLYEEPYDEARPVVCFDETNKQLIGEKHLPLLAKPGRPACYDYEYKRNCESALPRPNGPSSSPNIY